MNSSTEKPAGILERIRCSIWTYVCGWARSWLKHLPSVPIDGYELYMRWPGERMPPPPPESGGPPWGAQADWGLAA